MGYSASYQLQVDAKSHGHLQHSSTLAVSSRRLVRAHGGHASFDALDIAVTTTRAAPDLAISTAACVDGGREAEKKEGDGGEGSHVG